MRRCWVRYTSVSLAPASRPPHGFRRRSFCAAHSEPLFAAARIDEEVVIENSTKFADVQVLFDTGMSLVCLVDGIRVRVPMHLIEACSEVRRNGDRGTLVIPTSFALSLGLV